MMFFHLIWTGKRPGQVIFSDKKPDNCNFEGSFRIKKETFTICGTIHPKMNTYYPPPKLIYSKNQYLSSHLQKCIRRMDDVKSVQTAKHFLDLDCSSFLRRLPIIMLEDVTIHESIGVIVWLMIAVTKGFQLKWEMVKWLLGVVYYLSNEPMKTNYFNTDREEIDLSQQKEDRNILYSLRFRKAYGGMKGDMNMIEYYIQEIIQKNISVKRDKIQYIKLGMDQLKYSEWVYQANDFHCNRSIPRQVQSHIPNMDEERIRKLIWYFSSSLNKRFTIEYSEKDTEDWEKIRKVVRKVQKSCKFY